MDTPAAILRQILRTAALVIPLGLVLYLVLSGIAMLPNARTWIVLGLALPFTTLMAVELVAVLRTGRVPVRFSEILREAHPRRYWAAVLGLALTVVALLALLVWSGLMIVEEAGPLPA